jgi:cGMP-dependent protein kinase
MGCHKSKNSKPEQSTILENPSKRSRSQSQQIVPLILPDRQSSRRSIRVSDARKRSDFSELFSGELQLSKKTAKDYELISKSLSGHFLFSSLSDENMISIIEEFKLYKFPAKTIIFNQGLFAENFYIIAQGRAEVIVNLVTKKIITKGEYFGEIALLHDSTRTASIKTIEQSFLWTLGRSSFKRIITSINSKKLEENQNFVNNIEIFKSFSNSQKDILLSLIVTQEFSDGVKIVQENDPGDLLYIIQKGFVTCSKEGKELRRLGKGEVFGDQALLYNTPRTATVTATGRCTLLSLGREDLVRALGSHLLEIIYKNSLVIAIEKSKGLRSLSKTQIDSLYDKVKTCIQPFKFSEVVITKGSPKKEKIFIVLKGCIKSSTTTFGLYSCIGDEAVLRESKSLWEEDFLADCSSDVAVIFKQDLEEAIGGKMKSVKTQNEIIQVLKKVSLFRNLPPAKLENLANNLKIVRFKAGRKIFEEGDEGDVFFIVKDGQVEIFRGKTIIRVIGKFDYFGERSIILDEKRTATVVSKTRSHCWTLTKKNFLQIIDEGMRRQLLIRILLQNDLVELKDLLVVKPIGKGMFGVVFLVHCSSNNSFYALKTVNRQKAADHDIYDNLKLERKILLQVEHPFIVKLVKTFRDSSRLYFLMEFVQGQDLFDAIRSIGILTNESARFYMACILLIFEHLHEQKIIYRDLKPENIMIDQSGYPKLIDFGTTKVIESRTFTLVGTPHYMAPEVIKGSGYGLQADVWSMGIMLFEFVCGCVPFGESEEDPYKIYSKVLECNLKFPAYMSTTKPRVLIHKLLDSNPLHRGSVENIKQDLWLTGVLWEQILSKNIRPPYLPKLEKLSTEHQKALKSNKSLEACIQQHEELENRTSSDYQVDPQAGVREIPADWDADF